MVTVRGWLTRSKRAPLRIFLGLVLVGAILGALAVAGQDPRPAASGTGATSTTVASRDATSVDGRSGSPTGCALPNYPTVLCTGVPAGWSPRKTTTGDLTVTKEGTVIEDHLVTGDIDVRAANVTIRRSRVYGTIDNFTTDKVFGPMLIEDTEIVVRGGATSSSDYRSAVGQSDYTCRRCKIMYRNEGFRVGGACCPGAGPITIEDSYILLSTPPGACETIDPHGDGIQAYGGTMATIRHNVVDQRTDPCPTAPIFIPIDQDNDGATVVDNVFAGGSFTVRLTGDSFPAVTGNKVVDGSWHFGPVDVDCSRIGTWSGNEIVTFDFAAGRITGRISALGDCG